MSVFTESRSATTERMEGYFNKFCRFGKVTVDKKDVVLFKKFLHECGFAIVLDMDELTFINIHFDYD